MKSKFERILSLVLALTLVFNLMPYGAFAQDETIDNATTFEVKFLQEDGTTQIGETQKVNQGESAVAPTEIPVIEGKEFKGWDKEFIDVQSNLDITAVYQELPAAPAVESPQADPTPAAEEVKVVSPLDASSRAQKCDLRYYKSSASGSGALLHTDKNIKAGSKTHLYTPEKDITTTSKDGTVYKVIGWTTYPGSYWIQSEAEYNNTVNKKWFKNFGAEIDMPYNNDNYYAIWADISVLPGEKPTPVEEKDARFYILLPNTEIPTSAGDKQNKNNYVPNDGMSMAGTRWNSLTGIPGGKITKAAYDRIPNSSNRFEEIGGLDTSYYKVPASLGSLTYLGQNYNFDELDIVWYSMTNNTSNGVEYYNIDGYVKDAKIKVTYFANFDGAQPVSISVDKKTGENFTPDGYDKTGLPSREGYTFKGWVDNAGNAYTGGLLKSDLNLYAVWEVIPVAKFKVTTSSDAGSLVTPTKEYTKGEDAVITFSAKNGYIITDIAIDGKVLEGKEFSDAIAAGKYTFSGIQKDHTVGIKAVKDMSKEIKYTVKYVEKDNKANVLEEVKLSLTNQWTGATEGTVNAIDSKTFANYEFDSSDKTPATVKADGTSVLYVYYTRVSYPVTVKHVYNGNRNYKATENIVVNAVATPFETAYDYPSVDKNKEVQYMLTSITVNGTPVTGMAASGKVLGATEIVFTYDVDMLSKGEKPDGPDKTPDKYQLVFTYASSESKVAISGIVKEVQDLPQIDNTFGAAHPKAAVKFNSAGYDLIRWNYTSVGSAESTVNTIEDVRQLNLLKDTDFVAVFQAVAPVAQTYNTVYYLNGTVYSSSSHYPGEALSILGAPAVGAGYRFNGWSGFESSQPARTLEIYGTTTYIGTVIEEPDVPEGPLPSPSPSPSTTPGKVIVDEEVPQGGGLGNPAWALLNLILAMATTLISIILLAT
ncbi:MAG: InlB B-repeat-containing protein, partial [Oscillospiraceae bacterium]